MSALGALFAAGVVAVLGWHWVNGSDLQPDIQVRTVGMSRGSGGVTIRFEASNRGGRTASEVAVEGSSGGETGAIVFDHLPGGSVRQGSLIFKTAPDPDGVRWRVVGYRDP